MTEVIEMRKTRSTARVAGIWYLLLGICAGFSWMHITRIYNPDDALKTAANINAAQTEYIVSVIAAILGQLSFLFLAMTLYRLLKKTDELQALIMFVLVCVSIPLMFMAIVFQTGAFVLLNRADYLTAFTTEQVAAGAATSLHLYFITVNTVQIFWGLWLFPFALLAFKSDFFPKILCLLLIISGAAYILGSISALASPPFHALTEQWLSIPQALGEIMTIFFLLIFGVKQKKQLQGESRRNE